MQHPRVLIEYVDFCLVFEACSKNHIVFMDFLYYIDADNSQLCAGSPGQIINCALSACFQNLGAHTHTPFFCNLTKMYA